MVFVSVFRSLSFSFFLLHTHTHLPRWSVSALCAFHFQCLFPLRLGCLSYPHRIRLAGGFPTPQGAPGTNTRAWKHTHGPVLQHSQALCRHPPSHTPCALTCCGSERGEGAPGLSWQGACLFVCELCSGTEVGLSLAEILGVLMGKTRGVSVRTALGMGGFQGTLFSRLHQWHERAQGGKR